MVLPRHEHPLVPFTRFALDTCEWCRDYGYIYGGYRCNELGCQRIVFHKDCVNPLPEVNHSSHPNHSLILINLDRGQPRCTICNHWIEKFAYFCSKCDYKLDLKCAHRPAPLALPANSDGQEHPLEFSRGSLSDSFKEGGSDSPGEAYHISHPQHPLKPLKYEVVDYADENCLLCGEEFNEQLCGEEFDGQLYHFDVCNFSICKWWCFENPPPVGVVSPTTHEHQLHLVPRRVNFTCNACDTQGDRSPYFCLQCNFMIHRECIDLPRVININRHDHRISYTPRLGHGEWKCKVCRKNVDGFYGAYTCAKCPTFVAHARCATRDDVWDMMELEGKPEEEEIAPFEMIDENTIKHFSHDHNLHINKGGMILDENIVCEACVFQVCSEPFYSCEQCHFILHEKCANLPRKKRHVCHNQQFTLHTKPTTKWKTCRLCDETFNGFWYESGGIVLDVRCSSMTDSLSHGSHAHPLYYKKIGGDGYTFSCDECEFSLNFKCVVIPQKVTRHRYDDHPLSLSYGQSNADGKYWCEACEAEVDSERWFYTCHDCGVVLHISCVVGSFSYMMPMTAPIRSDDVLYNTSICRPLCYECNDRCKLPSVYKIVRRTGVLYFCSWKCARGQWKAIKAWYIDKFGGNITS